MGGMQGGANQVLPSQLQQALWLATHGQLLLWGGEQSVAERGAKGEKLVQHQQSDANR